MASKIQTKRGRKAVQLGITHSVAAPANDEGSTQQHISSVVEQNNVASQGRSGDEREFLTQHINNQVTINRDDYESLMNTVKRQQERLDELMTRNKQLTEIVSQQSFNDIIDTNSQNATNTINNQNIRSEEPSTFVNVNSTLNKQIVEGLQNFTTSFLERTCNFLPTNVEKPSFSGKSDENPMKFLKKFKHYCKITKVPIEEQVNKIITCLNENAESWVIFHGESFTDFNDFEGKFIRRFWSDSVQEAIRTRIMSRRFNDRDKLTFSQFFIAQVNELRMLTTSLPDSILLSSLMKQFPLYVQNLWTVYNDQTLNGAVTFLELQEGIRKVNPTVAHKPVPCNLLQTNFDSKYEQSQNSRINNNRRKFYARGKYLPVRSDHFIKSNSKRDLVPIPYSSSNNIDQVTITDHKPRFLTIDLASPPPRTFSSGTGMINNFDSGNGQRPL